MSVWIGNVGYLVTAFGALGCFFPVFGEGNTLAAVLGASIVTWVVHALVLRDIQVQAACDFVLATGRRAVIGSLERIEGLLAGRAGTEVCVDGASAV